MAKEKKAPSELRNTLAHRVRAMMEKKFSASSNKPISLAEKAQVSLSTVQRVLDQQAGASIDTIDSIAHALDVEPYELLITDNASVDTNITTGHAYVRAKSLDQQMGDIPIGATASGGSWHGKKQGDSRGALGERMDVRRNNTTK